MLGLLILFVVWLMLGCAIAFGDNSHAVMGINTDLKREVDWDNSPIAFPDETEPTKKGTK